jgi:hypothetical protein
LILGRPAGGHGLSFCACRPRSCSTADRRYLCSSATAPVLARRRCTHDTAMRLASLAGLALISHSLAILNNVLPNSLWGRHRGALSLIRVWTACSVHADGELLANVWYNRSSRPLDPCRQSSFPNLQSDTRSCVETQT